MVNEEAEVNASWPLRWASSQVGSRFINIETSISGTLKEFLLVHILHDIYREPTICQAEHRELVRNQNGKFVMHNEKHSL